MEKYWLRENERTMFSWLSYILSSESKLTLFPSFIVLNFNFFCLNTFIWHYYSNSDTKKIEKIQERALRFVHCDFQSHKELRGRAGVPIPY